MILLFPKRWQSLPSDLFLYKSNSDRMFVQALSLKCSGRYVDVPVITWIQCVPTVAARVDPISFILYLWQKGVWSNTDIWRAIQLHDGFFIKLQCCNNCYAFSHETSPPWTKKIHLTLVIREKMLKYIFTTLIYSAMNLILMHIINWSRELSNRCA